ncbi:Nudix family hydrolase [Dyella sp. 20L07]|uniref:Nudix family hydrolase n=1 Tax=Dyella sp. 20L07 TaxID=3384240 RepID=UPI003D275B9B
MSPPETRAMHVMAGVMIDAQGRVLLAQRPPGKHLAGLWEFPGGKLEEGETPTAGLARELHEELGVEAAFAEEPLIRVPWLYGERALLLDAWIVRRWQGEPSSLEGQALQWCEPRSVDLSLLAPADRPILRALQLPPRYVITPADTPLDAFDAWRERVSAAIEAGQRLISLRLPLWSPEHVRALAASLKPVALAHGAQLLLSGDITGARELGEGVGVQLKAHQITMLDDRPLPLNQWVGASCHNAAELAQALTVADFATLSPVKMTASHPDTPALGWPAFRTLVGAAAMPVYALGGMTEADILGVREAGGQGVAGIRGFW